MIALNYQKDLSKWADVDYYDTHVLRVQLPYIAPTTTPGLTLEQQKERKRELARRLMEINARKREERVGTFCFFIHILVLLCNLMFNLTFHICSWQKMKSNLTNCWQSKIF